MVVFSAVQILYLLYSIYSDYRNAFKLCDADENTEGNPQTLLFSATLPHWVHETAQKYLRPDRRHLDLVCDDDVKTSKTVRVCTSLPSRVLYHVHIFFSKISHVPKSFKMKLYLIILKFCLLRSSAFCLDVLMFNEITTDLNSFYHSIVVRCYRNGAGSTVQIQMHRLPSARACGQ